ncbi:aromatic-ring-hydroxylating dioxygenase subunit beta [Streptomyces sp. 6N223]|uniref:aromatic-ring-hydroxylating dioxygenase subunit beta n=1 Tax=Streptomyces sp. 6N223 TaxID=3457412 RepID=UPI003FD1CA27
MTPLSSRAELDSQLVAEAADFLYHEARLLDSRSFDAWLGLYAEDAIYSVPQDARADPLHRVSLLYENRARLAERVLRLNSGFAYAQEPPSRTVHLVGNVRVTTGESDGLLHVTSNLMVTEARRGRQHVYAGEVDHRLRRTDGGHSIVFKEIRLVNSDFPLGNVTFLL